MWFAVGGFFNTCRRTCARGKHVGATRRRWCRAGARSADRANPADRGRAAHTAATIAPDKPGFFHELGRWWDGSIGYLHDKIKAAPGTFEDIGKKSGDAAKGAAVATGKRE